MQRLRASMSFRPRSRNLPVAAKFAANGDHIGSESPLLCGCRCNEEKINKYLGIEGD